MIKKTSFIALFCIISAALPSVLRPVNLEALNASVRSVNTLVMYQDDGIVDISATIEWSVSGGEMHAFVYQGEKDIISFDSQKCWVDIPGSRRLPLVISKLGKDEYDIVIADGQGFSGTGFFVLHYQARVPVGLTVAGKSDTSAPAGVYFFFNWGPPDWEYNLALRITTIVFPINIPLSADIQPGTSLGPVSGDGVSPIIKELGLLTEPFVNQQNKIDWCAIPIEDGKNYFTLSFFQENVPPRSPQRLQFYLNAESPPVMAGLGISEEDLSDARSGGGSGKFSANNRTRGEPRRFPISPLVLFAGGILGLLAYRRKLKAFPAISALLEEIRWAGDAWDAPKIQAGSYQVPGKIPGIFILWR